MRRTDIEEAQFVRPGGVIGARLLDRIAGVTQFDEVHALHDAAVGYVETRYDSGADRHALARRMCSRGDAETRRRGGAAKKTISRRGAEDAEKRGGSEARGIPMAVAKR
ncbi:hypothetical protein HMP09_1833 [Sphingomonas sp. HMP9]|nr:hypothetical protein HMP09_1833 [Sphingomonas sp. HMP9]